MTYCGESRSPRHIYLRAVHASLDSVCDLCEYNFFEKNNAGRAIGFIGFRIVLFDVGHKIIRSIFRCVTQDNDILVTIKLLKCNY